jgi:hypothetical protein
VATTALASIPGDPFRLGQTNGVDAMSTLVGNVAGTMLMVDNNSMGAGATALDLRVEPGKAPMKVNSGARVALLNADRVDGKDATAFYAAGSKVADSNLLDGKSATDFAAACKRTVVVSPTGTDTENGQALLNALNGITDASATKKYLIYIEPGTYDLGSGTLQMKQHVRHTGRRGAKHYYHQCGIQRMHYRYVGGSKQRRVEVPHGAQHIDGVVQHGHLQLQCLSTTHPRGSRGHRSH